MKAHVDCIIFFIAHMSTVITPNESWGRMPIFYILCFGCCENCPLGTRTICVLWIVHVLKL